MLSVLRQNNRYFRHRGELPVMPWNSRSVRTVEDTFQCGRAMAHAALLRPRILWVSSREVRNSATIVELPSFRGAV